MLSKAIFRQLTSQSRCLPKASFGAFVNHRDTDDNSESTPFEFTPENYKEIEELMTNFPTNYRSSGVIPLLMMAQKQNNNFLTLSAMHKVAKICEVPNI